MHEVSILIPFRNEEDRFTLLLNALQNLHYDPEKLEIIFIDDHSSDSSQQLLKNAFSSIPFPCKVINLPESFNGKKEAIKYGVENSKYEIILTTDADCQPSPDWIVEMQKPFANPKTQLVSGNVYYLAKNLWERILQTEFAAYIGVGAVAIKQNPLMLNGACISYRKSIFFEVNPYDDNEEVAGGDDIFLASAIQQNYPGSIVFNKRAKVGTIAPQNLRSLLQQRIRWGAKWKSGSNIALKLVAIGVWLFHFSYLLLLLSLVFQKMFVLLLAILILKFVVEFIFLREVLKAQGQKISIFGFTSLQIVYSFYVLFIGLFSNFTKVKWKDRTYG